MPKEQPCRVIISAGGERGCPSYLHKEPLCFENVIPEQRAHK